jgi:hypothetical protein
VDSARGRTQMTPLYGFLQGDTIGLLVLAYDEDSMGKLVEKLKMSASVRVAPKPGGSLYFNGKRLENELLLPNSGIEALDRIDVRWENT